MKRVLLTSTLLTALAGGGWAVAQSAAQPSKAPAPAEHAHVHGGAPGGSTGTASPAATGMGMGMGGTMDKPGGGGMGMGMCSGMMAEMCPMKALMSGADTKIAVKNIDKGVTITLTSTDAAKVARLQKMAESMRLMHDATMP
jgi:hypothetical protein